MDAIGPDEEIERAGKEFEAFKKIRPHSKMTFQQYLEIQAPRPSNSWSYVQNRRGRTLISF